MNIQDFRFYTIEQLSEYFLLTDADLLQLSIGPLDFTSTQVELSGVQLEWNRVGAMILNREAYRGSGLMFGFVLESPKPLKFHGHEVDNEYALVWHPGSELEYVAPMGLSSLVIHVDAAFADLLGWTLKGSGWQQVTSARLQKLKETCYLATRAARQQVNAGNEAEFGLGPNPDTLHWRDRILADLDGTLEPWLSLPQLAGRFNLGNHCFRLVKGAERVFAQYDLGQPLTIDAVAETLGVSRRTLFRAFRSWLGVSPYVYLTLVRLHRLRDRLLEESPTDTYVATVAYEVGFRHLGRLSAIYRKLFGEYPSDMLKRK